MGRMLSQVARPLPVVLILDLSCVPLRDAEERARLLLCVPAAFESRAALRNSGEVALITTGAEGALLQTGDAGQPPYGFVAAADLSQMRDTGGGSSADVRAALSLASAMVERRCRQIADAGRSSFRPYVALVTGDAAGRRASRPALGDRMVLETFAMAAGKAVDIAEAVALGADSALLAGR